MSSFDSPLKTTAHIVTTDHEVPIADTKKDEESAVESPVLSRQSEDVVSPVFIHPCLFHPGEKCTDDIELFADPTDRVKLIVGTHPNTKTFLIHRRLLVHHSAYFKTALREGNATKFTEAETGTFTWPDDDPETVHSWVRWMYSCPSCRVWAVYDPKHVCPEDSAVDAVSWCNKLAEPEQAYVLGDRVVCPDYCKFAFASFIQHAHLIHPTRIIWAYENTAEESSMHRFITHWIAWTKFLVYKRTPTLPPPSPTMEEEPIILTTKGTITTQSSPPQEKHSYSQSDTEGTEGTTDLHAVYHPYFTSTPGWTSIDPRDYFMAHWTSPCSGQVYARCPHKRVCHFFAGPSSTYFLLSQYGDDETDFGALGYQLSAQHHNRYGPHHSSVAAAAMNQQRFACRSTYLWMNMTWVPVAIVMLGLGPHVYRRAPAELISRENKVVDVLASVLGIVGVLYCRRDLYKGVNRWQKFSFPGLVWALMMAAAGFSCYAAAGCFETARTLEMGVGICKLQTGLASMQILYSIFLGRLIRGYWIGRLPRDHSQAIGN